MDPPTSPGQPSASSTATIVGRGPPFRISYPGAVDLEFGFTPFSLFSSVGRVFCLSDPPSLVPPPFVSSGYVRLKFYLMPRL